MLKNNAIAAQYTKIATVLLNGNIYILVSLIGYKVKENPANLTITKCFSRVSKGFNL
jgi:hypothetical protein